MLPNDSQMHKVLSQADGLQALVHNTGAVTDEDTRNGAESQYLQGQPRILTHTHSCGQHKHTCNFRKLIVSFSAAVSADLTGDCKLTPTMGTKYYT